MVILKGSLNKEIRAHLIELPDHLLQLGLVKLINWWGFEQDLFEPCNQHLFEQLFRVSVHSLCCEVRCDHKSLKPLAVSAARRFGTKRLLIWNGIVTRSTRIITLWTGCSLLLVAAAQPFPIELLHGLGHRF